MFNLDQQTMFLVNAIMLLVFAFAFALTSFGEKDRSYWIHLVASNILFACAFFIFSHQIDGTPNSLLLPNGLLVVGLGLRWQATRIFFGKTSSPLWFIILTAITILSMVFSSYIGKSFVFGFINLVITAQILMIVFCLIETKEPLPSKYGLLAAYIIIIASSILRVLQGWLFSPNLNTLLPSDIFLEINLIAAAIHISASGAFSLSIAYERSVAGLREIAMRDALTNLYNRRSIETLSEIVQNNDSTYKASLIVLDIDHFKSINDKYGHAAGDIALKYCADLIRHTFRDYDLIARIGGEEFLILMPEKGVREAVRLTKKLQNALATDHLSFKETTITLTISAGISYGLANPLLFPKLLEEADRCLYIAKAKGRNRIEIDDGILSEI